MRKVRVFHFFCGTVIVKTNISRGPLFWNGASEQKALGRLDRKGEMEYEGEQAPVGPASDPDSADRHRPGSGGAR